MIFSSLLQPYFDYCSVVWDGCSTTLAGKIQKLQNRAVRVLNSASYDISTEFFSKNLDGKISNLNDNLKFLIVYTTAPIKTRYSYVF